MRSSTFVLTLAALAVCGAAGFAADRYAALRSAREDREAAQDLLKKAAALVAAHPRVFGPGAPVRTGDISLKALAQEAAVTRGVSLGYLSESERDTDRGQHERQVLIRLVNAGHANVVLYLQDLETRGGGARIRELHVRPSRTLPDAYEEVEVVVTKSAAKAEGKGS